MKWNNYIVLNKLLKELKNEKQELDEQIKINSRCMKEADVYIDSFLSGESEDYRLFSPRNSENLHKEVIDRTNEEKKGYVSKIEHLSNKEIIISERIEQLENILKEESRNLVVLNIQEEDRQRIARDLHDSSLQNLAHLVHKIELSSLYIDKDPLKAKLELSTINKHLKETIDEIRNTIFDLRPMSFDDLGLKAAFEDLLFNINENNEYKIDAEIDEILSDDNIVLVSIFRIVQECMFNIVKHAEADAIYFRCKCRNNKCNIQIKDNGKGFEKTTEDGKKHFGLSLMKERVELLCGFLEIHSEIGKGTEVSIEIPLMI